jgi:citrate/tricarballylate utilization protein
LAALPAGKPHAMHATEALAEADRLMTICNACRYCEGLCAVFPAMEMQSGFADGQLNYLANLCHGCGACYHDCQFSPPHEFNVNVPQTLAVVRADSYASYAWPGALSGLFARNGLAISLIAASSVAAFILGFVGLNDPASLFTAPRGDFYALMPHSVMALLFSLVFLFAIASLTISARRFWIEIPAPNKHALSAVPFLQAVRDAGELRYLDGGGVGCFNEDDRPTDRRRLFHHLTFYGFLLCFASTCVATLYHYLLGREAPYPIYDLPVLLGAAGGIGLIAGPIGLFYAKRTRDPALVDKPRLGMDVAFLAMLFLTGLTGMALLMLRDTALMGSLLAVHLGIVFALFLTMPYGKFVHGIYRFLALVRYAQEQRAAVHEA